MSLPIAIQSAIFYFAACTPCAKVRHRQKARERAARDRKEKEARDKAQLESEEPSLYQHPAPFQTNPYWQTEIDIGPRLPKRAVSKNSSQRALASSCRDSSIHPSISEDIHLQNSRLDGGDSAGVGAGAAAQDEESGPVPDDWNRRHGYQREDEELWGQWSGHKIMDAFSKARGSAGRLIDATLRLDKEVTEQERREFYFAPKNPPVNDYHPPVVSSRAPHKEAHRWMLQPPPPAKVMEGKVPVGRAASSGSKSSGRTLVSDDPPLSRLMQEKLVQERLRKETSPTETELIDSLFLTRSNRSLSYPRSRSLSLDGSEESLEHALDWNRRVRPRPVAAPPGCTSEDEDDLAALRPMPSGIASTPARAAQRPKLETIQSSGSFSSSRRSSQRTGRPRPPLTKRLSGATSPVGDDSD